MMGHFSLPWLGLSAAYLVDESGSRDRPKLQGYLYCETLEVDLFARHRAQPLGAQKANLWGGAVYLAKTNALGGQSKVESQPVRRQARSRPFWPFDQSQRVGQNIFPA